MNNLFALGLIFSGNIAWHYYRPGRAELRGEGKGYCPLPQAFLTTLDHQARQNRHTDLHRLDPPDSVHY